MTKKKCQFLLYLDLIKIRLEIMLSYFEEKKETFFTIKNRIFQRRKNRIFFQSFWSKNANYLVYLDLVKIRLEIMLSYFAEKKKPVLTMKNRIF